MTETGAGKVVGEQMQIQTDNWRYLPAFQFLSHAKGN